MKGASRLSLILVGLAMIGFVAGSRPAHAASDDQPWVLDANNWQEGKDLLPEPVVKRLQKGEYWFKVVPLDPKRFHDNYVKSFWDASEANAGKYDLEPKQCGLRDKATGKIPDFVLGYPFPKIESGDPQAGCKIAWNFTFAGLQGGGGGATFTLNGVDTTGEFRRIKAFLHSMGFQGRLDGPQKDNPENLTGQAIGGALEPQDVEGVSTLSKRFWDWESQDAIWAYVPSTRRARRVNAASRSDPVGGLDIFADDLNCYAGKVEYYQWKVIGEGKVLAPVLQPYPFPMKQVSPSRFLIETPYMKAGYEVPGSKGVPWWIQENLVFVPRPVWIVEGQSSDPYYNFGKVIMYFDKEMYRIYWKLVHNRAGEYFYTAACGYHFIQTDDHKFATAFPSLVIGVNDKINRSALGGRYQSSFIERVWDPAYFSLRTLTHMSD
jgi:hypothetical protein